MGKLSSLLSKEPLTLIVRLPENSAEMAEAARSGGAHAVAMSIDPSQKDKKDVISIIKSLDIPVGITLENNIGAQELAGLVKLGVDFVDLPLAGARENPVKGPGFDRILALGPDYNAIDLTRLSEGSCAGLDAAVILEEEWGRELTVGDLQQYITIAMSTMLPVIVPAQKAIRISEVPIIWDTGAKGIMIGGNVTGDDPVSLKAVTAEFRAAIESLKNEYDHLKS
jgi:hypothetical protein